MARISIDDCLEKIQSRFMLVHLAARRSRQLRRGAPSMSGRDNREVVLALREIANGYITLANVDQYEPLPKDELDISEVEEEIDDEE